MNRVEENWLGLLLLTLSVAVFVLGMYYIFFELRWYRRQDETKQIIKGLRQSLPVDTRSED